MTVEEQLKAEILSRYRSLRAFSSACGIPNTTVDSIFRRGIWNSGIQTVIKVFDALDLDIESVKDGDLRRVPKVENSASSGKDEALLESFHQLNGEGQSRLLETADDMVRSGKYAIATQKTRLTCPPVGR